MDSFEHASGCRQKSEPGFLQMKIATYNVNGINSRLPVLLRWLQELKPDLVCLQELKAPDEKFPLQEIQEAGYMAVWKGQKSWNGVAVLSRSGNIREISRELPGSTDDLQSRYLEVEADGLVLGCLYLPNGNPWPGPKFDYKLAWCQRLLKHSKHLLDQKTPVVLAGDFNIIPTAGDVYKPENWTNDALYREEVRAFFGELLHLGWQDALRFLHPGETIYTYWDYFRNAYERNAGLRIDHFLLSPSLVPRLRHAVVDRYVRGWEKTSDHAPVWIELHP